MFSTNQSANDDKNNIRFLYQPNWQFNVIYFGSHVIKFPKLKKQRREAIKQSRLGNSLNSIEINYLLHETIEAQQISVSVLNKSPELRRLCGEPYIFWNKLIVQKRGHAFLYQRTDDNLLQLIDQFFSLNEEIWKIGVFEGTFDFLRNCGVLSDGNPFFIDLGDFTEDAAKARSILKEKRWESRLDYKSLNTRERQYFDELSKNIFSLENFNSKWRSKLSNE